MPEIINCPQCERKLRVPDNLIGQAVKCPTCSTTFTATAAASAPAPPQMTPPPLQMAPPPVPPPVPPPLPASGPPPLPPLPPPGELERRYAEMAPPEEAPPPFRNPGYPGSPMPGSAGDDDFESRRRAQRYEARRSVEGPATALLVVGIIGVIVHLGVIGWSLTVVGGINNNPGFGRNQFQPPLGCPFGDILGLILDVIVIMGSQKMKNLESYGLATASCIIAMVNFVECCCVLGLPFGIWGLVALNQTGVRESFRG